MTYLRPGELLVLEWRDVDVEHHSIHVTKAWNYTDEEPKAPKTRAGVRDVPIEGSLLPLLRRMKRARKADDLVAPQLSTVHRVTLPEMMRRHLLAAGIERTALHVSTDLEHRAVFRTWRDTGLTWSAMTGIPLQHLMRRAGHESPRTTMGYVKQAEDVTGKLGRPFPRLPQELVK
jgi:integrase